MTEQVPPVTAEDAAWASVNTPLSVEQLSEFCQDIERLFRINPMLEFQQWQRLDDARYLSVSRNSSQETPFELETELTVSPLSDGFKIEYSNGIKTSTTIKIAPTPEGSKLTLIDCYEGLSEEDRQQRLGEVDKSITTWASYLQRYLVLWKRWSGVALWRWYMRRIWQPMKPTGRRITYMLLWISVVEVALIALGVGIYFAEYA